MLAVLECKKKKTVVVPEKTIEVGTLSISETETVIIMSKTAVTETETVAQTGALVQAVETAREVE